MNGRVTMITGGSRGLGAALARAFAEAGARVSIGARHLPELESVAEEIRSAGGECLPCAVDVTRESEVRRWVAAVEERWGAPEVLINNAGVLGPREPLASYPVDEWRRTMEANLTGSLLTIQAVLPGMRAAGSGSIINVSSGAAVPPRREWGAYAVSKLALEGLTRNLAAELKGSGVRANIVDPGAMRTRMRADAYPDEDPGTVKAPRETAPVFLWLAGDSSAQVTGERFQADVFRPPE